MASGGRVHFIVITDIARSSFLWETFPKNYAAALEKHNTLLVDIIHRFEGEVMKNVGDGYIALFGSAHTAVCAAVAIQRAIAGDGAEPLPAFPDGKELMLRAIVHGGTLHKLGSGRGWFGPPLNRAARMCSACHPGQTLISGYVQERLVEVPDGCTLLNLGEFRLRDMGEPELLFQVSHPSFKQRDFPPLQVTDDRPEALRSQAVPAAADKPESGKHPDATGSGNGQQPAAHLAPQPKPAPSPAPFPAQHPHPAPPRPRSAMTPLILALGIVCVGIIVIALFFQRSALHRADADSPAGGSTPPPLTDPAGDNHASTAGTDTGPPAGSTTPNGGTAPSGGDTSSDPPLFGGGHVSDNSSQPPASTPLALPVHAIPGLPIEGYACPGSEWRLGTRIEGESFAGFATTDAPLSGFAAFAMTPRSIQFSQQDVGADVELLMSGGYLAGIIIQVPNTERSYGELHDYYTSRYRTSDASFASDDCLEWLSDNGNFLLLRGLGHSTVIVYGQDEALPWDPGENLPSWVTSFTVN